MTNIANELEFNSKRKAIQLQIAERLNRQMATDFHSMKYGIQIQKTLSAQLHYMLLSLQDQIICTPSIGNNDHHSVSIRVQTSTCVTRTRSTKRVFQCVSQRSPAHTQSLILSHHIASHPPHHISQSYVCSFHHVPNQIFVIHQAV